MVCLLSASHGCILRGRHCPNLSLVDTPGLLVGGVADDESSDGAGGGAAGVAPGAASTMGASSKGETAIAARARLQAAGVEQLVREKIAVDEAIVLCVEESNNWDVAPAYAQEPTHPRP